MTSDCYLAGMHNDIKEQMDTPAPQIGLNIALANLTRSNCKTDNYVVSDIQLWRRPLLVQAK